MRKLFIITLLFFSLSSFTQSFNGVSISGDINTVVKNFEQKGFTIDRYVQGTAIMKGVIAGKDLDLFVLATPKSKQVWKIVALFNKHENWYSLKAEYENYCKIMRDKYGPPKDTYSYFLSPYESGDGYELQALRLEKAIFLSLWFLEEQNLNIGVKIDNTQRITLQYENLKLSIVKGKEQSEIEADSF